MENQETLGNVTESEVIEIQKEVKALSTDLHLEGGEIQASTVTQLATAVKAYRRAGLIPQHLKTDAEAIGAILYAKQINVPVLSGIGQIACVNGRFAPYGSLFTALAQRDPDFGYDEVVYFNEAMEIISLENKNLKDPAFGCRVRSQKKGSPFIMETIFTMEDARIAGIIRNVWKTYPKDMLKAKCIARNYRTLYPAALNGVMMAEDLQVWEPQEKEVDSKQALESFLGE